MDQKGSCNTSARLDAKFREAFGRHHAHKSQQGELGYRLTPPPSLLPQLATSMSQSACGGAQEGEQGGGQKLRESKKKK